MGEGHNPAGQVAGGEVEGGGHVYPILVPFSQVPRTESSHLTSVVPLGPKRASRCPSAATHGPAESRKTDAGDVAS